MLNISLLLFKFFICIIILFISLYLAGIFCKISESNKYNWLIKLIANLLTAIFITLAIFGLLLPFAILIEICKTGSY